MITRNRPFVRPPSSRAAWREQRRRRIMRRRILLLSAGALGIIGAIVGLILLFHHAMQPKEPPAPPEPVYFTYWNTEFEADPAYPASELLPEKFITEDGRMRYFSGSVPSHAGIDVSQHNGEIDWEAVAADGVEFAMLRVGYRGYTEGAVYEDERFRENYEGARAAGIKVGAYFFSQARSVEEAAQEAEFTLDQLRGLKLDLPVAYDWELIGQDNARAEDMDRETLTACTAEFCRRVSRHFDTMIYTNAYQCYFLLDLSQLSDYPIWFAGYASSPILYYRFNIWQYSDEGTVEGIERPTDLNICFFDLD